MRCAPGVAAAAGTVVRSLGRNDKGQLGTANFSNSADPLPGVNLTSGVAAITAATAGNHSMALKDDGSVLAWGENSVGNLGNGTIGGTSNVPAMVQGLAAGSGVTASAASGGTGLALNADKTLLPRGKTITGQPGNRNENRP